MDKKKSKWIVLLITCVCFFTFITTAYARDIGSWTKNLSGNQYWEGTVTQTRYHSTEDAVMNFTHPNAYVWWHGTNSSTNVYVQAFCDGDISCYTQDIVPPCDNMVDDNTRVYQNWYGNFTGETYLILRNVYSTMIDTKGTWSPDQT